MRQPVPGVYENTPEQASTPTYRQELYNHMIRALNSRNATGQRETYEDGYAQGMISALEIYDRFRENEK